MRKFLGPWVVGCNADFFLGFIWVFGFPLWSNPGFFYLDFFTKTEFDIDGGHTGRPCQIRMRNFLGVPGGYADFLGLFGVFAGLLGFI